MFKDFEIWKFGAFQVSPFRLGILDSYTSDSFMDQISCQFRKNFLKKNLLESNIFNKIRRENDFSV